MGRVMAWRRNGSVMNRMMNIWLRLSVIGMMNRSLRSRMRMMDIGIWMAWIMRLGIIVHIGLIMMMNLRLRLGIMGSLLRLGMVDSRLRPWVLNIEMRFWDGGALLRAIVTRWTVLELRISGLSSDRLRGNSACANWDESKDNEKKSKDEKTFHF
jgi:hypothetical protein